MQNYHWAILLIAFTLLFNKASQKDAFILCVGYLFYMSFIIPLPDIGYYAGTALLDFTLGQIYLKNNKYAAICCYSLVVLNLLGFWLWFSYYDSDLYDNICNATIVILLITIIPKELINGLRNSIQYFTPKSASFNGYQACVTMYKSQAIKKTQK